jgi:glycine/D-amino acid oxidase-like deaminating enzyme
MTAIDADVVIIGSGPAGVSAAWPLVVAAATDGVTPTVTIFPASYWAEVVRRNSGRVSAEPSSGPMRVIR